MRDFAKETLIDNRLARLEQGLARMEAVQAATGGSTTALRDVLAVVIGSHPDAGQVQQALANLPERQFQTPQHAQGYQQTLERLMQSLQTTSTPVP